MESDAQLLRQGKVDEVMQRYTIETFSTGSMQYTTDQDGEWVTWEDARQRIEDLE